MAVNLPVQQVSIAHDLYRATESVIGQERGRKAMAVILEGQWQIAQGVPSGHPGGVLLAGPSGMGKTMTARLMCRQLGLPYAEVDATRYAEVAYKGLQLPQMFIPLMQSATRMIDGPEAGVEHTDSIFKRADLHEIARLAQTGVVLLDEFDKWLNRINHVTGQRDTAIQGELLKMIEGSEEFVTATDDEVGVPFDTSSVLIICAGAFTSLYKQVRTRLHEDSDPRQQMMDDNFWNSIVPDDFTQVGLLPELAGRLSRHVFMRSLRTEHLKQILEARGGLLDYYRQRYEAMGVRWEVSQGGVLEILKVASGLGTGARGLEHVTHKMLGADVMYDAATASRPMRLILEANMPRAELRPL